METEPVDFIAERPHIHGNDIAMPWPSEDFFMSFVSDEALNADKSTSRGQYAVENELYGLRDDYFRMRYRGAEWCYEKFTGEVLPGNAQDRLDAFLSHGFWAPAIDNALELYAETDDPKYKTTAVFATGLHIWDALNHSWAFLDPSLADDSSVREKHYLIFLERIHSVSKLNLEGDEKEYFEQMRTQFNLAYAEMAAQSAVSAVRDLMIFDAGTDSMGHGPTQEDRSVLITFADAPLETKKRVVERFKFGAQRAVTSEYDYPGFHLEMLHLLGLTDIAEYEDIPDFAMRWLNLSAEEILASDTSKLILDADNMGPAEEFNQDSLF